MRNNRSWAWSLTLAACLSAGAASATTEAADAAAGTTAGGANGSEAAAAAPASGVVPAQLRQAFLARFPGVEPTEISATPFDGLYEVRVGRDLLYVDAQVNFLLQGSLIDAKSRTDLTAKRMEDLNRVTFSDLPLQDAIKQVRGAGTHQIAVFEDPNCGYCKQLHKTLAQMDDITVYTFLFPILSEDSLVKARNIWCADDRAKTWHDWMLRGTVPPEATCDTPVQSLLALGRSMMVQGTPAIIFADGSRVNGAMPLDGLRKKMAEAAKASQASKGG